MKELQEQIDALTEQPLELTDRRRIREIKERIDSVYFDRGDAHDLLRALLEQERLTEQARSSGWGKGHNAELPKWTDELTIEYLTELGATVSKIGYLPAEYAETIILGLLQQYRYTAEAEHEAEQLRIAWATLARREESEWELSWMT